MVKNLKTIITKQSEANIEIIKEEMISKDTVITSLETEVKDLIDKLHSFETHINNTEQYEQNGTVVVSGPALPPETAPENVKSLVVSPF